jgi:hypothetical protein
MGGRSDHLRAIFGLVRSGRVREGSGQGSGGSVRTDPRKLPHAPRPCAARARTAPPRSFDSSSAFSFSALLSQPRPHKVRTQPALPCLRRARTAASLCSTAAPSAPPPCATTSANLPHAAAHPPRPTAARFVPATWAVACWRRALLRRACWHNAPARFCTASRTDARSSSAPSAPCRLTGVQVRHGTAGRAAGDRCAFAPNSRLREAGGLPGSVAR